MTLHQMTQLKRWQVAHKHHTPIEYHTWDAVLTVWLMGWMGVPPALLLWQPYGVLLCVAAFFAPAGYARLRERLHRDGTLRCDWLEIVAEPSPMQQPLKLD